VLVGAEAFRKVVSDLVEEFELDSVKLIHDSLVDLLENESMNKPRRRHKA